MSSGASSSASCKPQRRSGNDRAGSPGTRRQALRRPAVDAPAGGWSEFHGRREDDRLLTGKGTYTADWNLPGQLYGHFLRSDRAHAEIVSLKKPAGVTVFTGEDTKELKTPPPMVR